ncbi:MAG: antibiotic biosynthesis monooxygenase [Chloroflexi bacterium]|nr:antibiotic biosynthesis monooxygenase [Chloroflexota bacterium]
MIEQPVDLQSLLNHVLESLKASEGCLGIETAQTASGKFVLFAWFENKRAVLRWYNSEAHQRVKKNFFPQLAPRAPLANVSDDCAPIMAIASIAFTDQSQHAETSLPISQIAIELYQPISEGIFLGGRFSPDRAQFANPKLNSQSAQ